MVQFIGVNFLKEKIQTTVIDHKAHLLQELSVPIPGLKPGSQAGVWEIPPQEWVRAGSLALQDTFQTLPVKQRKLWGFAISGPQGWIAIDPDFDTISPLRLTPGLSPIDDFLEWLKENPMQRNS